MHDEQNSIFETMSSLTILDDLLLSCVYKYAKLYVRDPTLKGKI